MASPAFHWESLAALGEAVAAIPFYLLRAGHHPLGAGGMGASTERGGLTSWVVVILIVLGVLGLVFLIRKPKR